MSARKANLDPAQVVALYRQYGSLVRVARELRVSDRTLNRLRAASPDLDRQLSEAKQAFLTARRESHPHGTRARAAHCHAGENGKACRPCREADNREHKRNRLDRSRLPFHLIPHGLNGYRNYACRCEKCRQAGSEDNKRYRAERQRQERQAA